MGVYIKSRFNYDPDALAFIQASSIPNTSQKLAVNQLVLDLKAYGIWGKMKAIYPFVGGSAFYHKWNLKDPRDLDAAFRLNFVGGWTHSSTGAKPNGVNGYADTFLISNGTLNLNSTHLSYYSRTQSNGTEVEIGSASGPNASTDSGSLIEIRTGTTTYFRINSLGNYITYTDADSRAFYISNRTASNVINGWRNNVKVATGSIPSSGLSINTMTIGAFNQSGIAYYSTKECAFSSIGDGLSDTEAANFYTAVQNFQIALGRSIGTQTVSDADAQAFVNAAVIEDQIQATAINQLVTDMKGYGLWSKMKAVYPFVGGTAASHKWNLKNPLDTDAAFRLVFNGGYTHDSNGITGNATNAYADTKLIPNTQLSLNDTHISIYIKTNNSGDYADMGANDNISGLLNTLVFNLRWSDGNMYARVHNSSATAFSNSNSQGFYVASRTNSSNYKLFKNNTSNIINSASTARSAKSVLISAWNNFGGSLYYSNRNYAFASIGDGLTDTEAANFYTVVQNFNTALNRQVT